MRYHPLPLGLAGLASLAGFVAVSRAVARRHTLEQDLAARDGLQNARTPAGEAVAEVAGPLGKEWLHVPVAAALSGWLAFRGGGTRAAVPLIASVASEAISRLLDHTPPHRHPPPGHPSRHKPSFPSGHATETSAVTLASAYVLVREELVPAAPAFTAAVALSLASALGRLYLDRHWVSDAAAGMLLGCGIAAGCAALYEMGEDGSPQGDDAHLEPSGAGA